MKTIIYSGGTFSYIRNHLALSAPAFGESGRLLKGIMPDATLILTKMADYNSIIVTNEDLFENVNMQLLDKSVNCIIMNAALCDYDGMIGDIPSGKHSTRLETRNDTPSIKLKVANKVISIIKQKRPDITVVGFKTTCGASEDEMIFKAKRMLDVADIVISNDTKYKKNIIIENSYISDVFYDRYQVFNQLAERLNNQKYSDDIPLWVSSNIL